MRPLGWVGVVLIAAGAVILVMRGVSYTKSRDAVDVGPLHLATEQKGFVPPYVGVIAIVVGAGLLFVGRGRPS
jgi:hypothetical protein